MRESLPTSQCREEITIAFPVNISDKFLPAKYSSPRASALSYRHRLGRLLDATRQFNAVTWVSGPAGSGKTSLVASYLGYGHGTAFWCRLDYDDNCPVQFFLSLRQMLDAHGLQGASRLPAYSANAIRGNAYAREFFRMFFGLLPPSFSLVLDDCHVIDGSGLLGDVLRIACEEMPANGHMYLLARAAIPSSFARLQLNGALASVSGADLLATSEEIAQILEAHSAAGAAQSDVARMEMMTGGWIGGIRIVLDRGNLSTLYTSSPAQALDSYFQQEVFNGLTDDQQEFLMQMALLPLVRVPWAGREGTARVDSDLLRHSIDQQLFIEECISGMVCFRLHPLLQQFLLAQASQRWTITRLNAEVIRAADILAADGEIIEAACLLLSHDLLDEANQLLRRNTGRLGSCSEIPKFHKLLLQCHIREIKDHAWLLYWTAAALHHINPEDAKTRYEASFYRFRQDGDIFGMALSFSGAIESILQAHSPVTALDAWIEIFDSHLRFSMHALPADTKITVLCAFFLAQCHRQPFHPDLGAYAVQLNCWLQGAGHTALTQLIRQCLALFALIRGEHAEADLVGHGVELTDSCNPGHVRWNHVGLNRLKVLIGLHTGKYAMRLDLADPVEPLLCSRVNVQNDALLACYNAWIFISHGETEHACTLIDQLDRKDIHINVRRFDIYMVLGAWRKYLRGEPAHALKYIEHASNAVLAHGAPYFTSVHLLGLGILAYLCGDPPLAFSLLAKSRDYDPHPGNPFIGFAYHLFSSHIEFDLGREQLARESLVKGISLGRKNGYFHFPYFPKSVASQICLRAMEAGSDAGYVQTLIKRNKLTADPKWTNAEAWPWPLRIYTLGRFTIMKAGQTINHAGKSQKKPLELLKALIAFGGRNVAESKLADVLWPDAEGDAACQALATTLFRLRKIIGEKQVRRQEGRLSLDPGSCWVDCWAFERLSNDSAAARAERAELVRRLYQGPFLDGEEDAVWAIPMRERLKAKYARMIK